MRVVRVNSERFSTPDGAWPDTVRSPDEVADEPESFYPIVLVTWHDAWFDFDQQDPQDCRADYLVRTVGFLVDDGPRFVSVAQEVLPDGDGFRAVTHIPRSIIEQISWLNEGTVPLAEPPAGVPSDPYTASVLEERASEGGMNP